MDRLGDEPVEQVVDELDLADQRVGEQCLPRVDRIAGERSTNGQPLVGGDVLDESEQLRRERRLGQRLGAVATDPSGHLDDVVGREAGQSRTVADVDLVHCAVVRRQRRDQAEGGLAVIGAAALHEQVGPLVDARVAVAVEQAALDLLHDRRSRLAVQLLAEYGVVRIEIAEVVGRDGAKLVQQPPRQLDVLGKLVSVLPAGSEGRPPSSSTRRTVRWFRPTIDDHGRVDAEPTGEAPLKADRDVTQADCAVVVVEQRLRPIPTGVQSTIQALGTV